MKKVFDAVVYNGGSEIIEKKKVYTEAIKSLGEKYHDVVCLTADMTYLLEVDAFRDKFPERAFDLGVAEQNMIGVASGMAQAGEVPFAHTFGCFITRRAMDQIVNAIAYAKKNVKMVGMMPGIASDGGPSHMAIDDISMMRSTPNMTVIDLGDSTETEQAVEAAYLHEGPVYLRMRRGKQHYLFDSSKYQLEIGESYWIQEGSDLCIVSSGIMTSRALEAASLLEKQGISTNILHVPSIKPIDSEGIMEMASRSKALITLDNHNVIGGLGSAVGEVLLENQISLPFYKIGIQDKFGKAANEPYLAQLFGLEPSQIAQTAIAFLEGKSNPQAEIVMEPQIVTQGGGWEEAWKN
ncbi:transketolase subunit B [Alteribacillus persepolensis]|uniref:Transketolase subunit B n=1 Tax=Alteribacillus persepolensis TaxID=568899 RepID=A0A1G8JUB1_9BACI|nr:transketolase C-terminal domain-containing protein [Alteribacillus persepolensis]SDI34796.1 transketolase subunit B [Alteribacillus persepolensis]